MAELEHTPQTAGGKAKLSQASPLQMNLKQPRDADVDDTLQGQILHRQHKTTQLKQPNSHIRYSSKHKNPPSSGGYSGIMVTEQLPTHEDGLVVSVEND